MDTIRSMLQGAVGAAQAGSGTGATGGGNGGDGGPQELNPNAAVLKDSLFGNLLGGNGHGDEQEGQPNVSYEIDARAEPSAEMQSLSEPYSYQVSYSRGGNDPESLGLSPLRSGSVAPPNAGAAELLSPILTVNKTKHDISTIASPSLDDDSETTSALMDTSEVRSEGDLTYRIPLETPSWAKDGNLRQVPTPSTFRSFRAEGLHVDMEAIFHGSGGGLDDVDDDDEGDVLGREEEEEEEADVEEADAKRRAEAFADNDGESPSLDDEEIQEEAGEEEGVGAAGTNEEVDTSSPPAEQKRAASAPTIPATPLTQTQIDQNEEDLERGILLSEREETERKAMEAQYEENLHNTLLASTREETANDDGELPAPDDGEIQEEAAEEGVGAAGANEEVDDPPAEANDATAASASSALDNFDMPPTQLALNLASTAYWWRRGKQFSRNEEIYGLKAKLNEHLLRKGKRGINACNIYVQTKPMGQYLLYRRRRGGDLGSFPVDLLREMGYYGLLLAVTQSAYLGNARNHEIPGGATEIASALTVSLGDFTTDSDGVRRAKNACCVADAIFNVLLVYYRSLALAPFGGERDLGICLRNRLCDKHGRILSFNDAMRIVNQTKDSDIPLNMARLTNKRQKGIDDGNFRHKLECLLALSAEEPERMFILQCESKDNGSTGHFVGLVNNMIYDNDEDTGGKFDAREYADEFLSGVRKAAEILVRPTKKKKRRKQGEVQGEGTNKKARTV